MSQGSNEPFGAVESVFLNSTQQQRRRASPYVLAPTVYPTVSTTTSKPIHDATYPHNLLVALFLLPALFMTLWNHSSSIPLQAFIYLSLLTYASDLADLREMYLVILWFGAIVMTAINTGTALAALGDRDATGSHLPAFIMKHSCEFLLFICTACWGTLQAKWLYLEDSLPAFKIQNALHTVLIPTSVVISLFHFLPFIVDYRSPDVIATFLSYSFAVLLFLAMLTLGSANRRVGDFSSDDFIIRSLGVKIHIALLLLGPPLIFTTSMHRRIMSNYLIWDIWFDLIIVWSLPYLLLYSLHLLRWNNLVSTPYQVTSLFGSSSSSNLRGVIAPIIISICFSLALNAKYLIPLARNVAYNFHGHNLPDTGLVSVMLTGSIVSALFAGWIAGRKSTVTGDPLFGEYQDDVVQLTLAITGVLAGKAVGMSWSLTPLPILAILGTAIWLSTRMVRYLAMVLFVVHSTFLVLWSYRYAGIDVKMKLFMGFELNIFRFGMINVGVSLLIFLVMGLAVRSSGGAGHKIIRRFDICGMTYLVYTLFQAILECTLLKYPLPFQDLSGVDMNDKSEKEVFLYTPSLAFISSATIFGLCVILFRYKIISPQTAVPIVSSSLGKAVAVFIDMKLGKQAINGNEDPTVSLMTRVLAATLLLFTTMAPRSFLSPIYFKTGSRVGAVAGFALPVGANRTIMIYGLVMLPLTLIACIPWILRPLVGVLSGHFGAYYVTNPAVSETFGWICAIWGVSLLSAVNHYLPDGGGEIWKKTSALAFLMGIGVALAAPTTPPWVFGNSENQAIQKLNPFVTVSSHSPIILRGSHAGGWGLLLASIATLLAITGPLDLRDRTEGGKKDRFLLFRTMIFSIFFGCGIALFMSLELMNDDAVLPLFCTTTACMAMCFFGTVGGVLCYMLDLKDFEEAEQVLKVWMASFPVFLCVSALSQLSQTSAHPFGEGGWLSTYLSVSGIIILAISVALRCRKSKNLKTRGIGNFCCCMAWVIFIVVLFGRYGIAGMDAGFELTTFLGIPASIMGTFVVSLVMLLLESETSKNARGRESKALNESTESLKLNWMCFNLYSSEFSVLAPPMTATVSVLMCASLYSIFLRGSIYAMSSQLLFDKIYSSNGDAEDLANLARSNLIHQEAVRTASILAETSFWTASNFFSPLLYVGCLVATGPSLYGYLLFLWNVPTTTVWAISIPLNLMPIILARGLPPLFAASIVSILGGLFHVVTNRGRELQSRMRI